MYKFISVYMELQEKIRIVEWHFYVPCAACNEGRLRGDAGAAKYSSIVQSTTEHSLAGRPPFTSGRERSSEKTLSIRFGQFVAFTPPIFAGALPRLRPIGATKSGIRVMRMSNYFGTSWTSTIFVLSRASSEQDSTLALNSSWYLPAEVSLEPQRQTARGEFEVAHARYDI